MHSRTTNRGFTLMEVLIAVTLMGLISVGIMIALRVGLSAMEKSNSRLMANRRVASTEAIVEAQIANILPVAADCAPASPDQPLAHMVFFQGESDSMRFVSTHSLQQADRGQPQILEFHVIPREDGVGVRLILNEHVYAGPRSAGLFCMGVAPDAELGQVPMFPPIQTGPGSFVLIDRLQYCRFVFRETRPAPEYERWDWRWTRPFLPTAIRIEMAPLEPDPGKLQLATMTVPIRINRDPLYHYTDKQQ